jgi:opacity protein-like surface antigen
MKKTLLTAVAVAALTLAAGQAQAADYAAASESGGWYVSVFGGVAFSAGDPEGNYFGSTTYSFDTDTGFIVGGAVGSTLWSDNVRGEIEVSYINQDVNDFNNETDDDSYFDDGNVDGDIGQWFLLANLWYDWHTDTGFTPYFGGGIGVGWADPDVEAVGSGGSGTIWDSGTIGFAGQLGAGVKWEFTDTIALDIGYRFKTLIASDIEASNEDECCNLDSVDFYNHVVQVGLTVGF